MTAVSRLIWFGDVPKFRRMAKIAPMVKSLVSVENERLVLCMPEEFAIMNANDKLKGLRTVVGVWRSVGGIWLFGPYER